MLSFYLIAGGLAAVAAIALARPLVAGRGAAEGRDARDAAVFRDQLSEIERDLARGTITPGEAEGARVEVSRRLIAAAERARKAHAPVAAPRGRSGLAAGLALVGTPALAATLYLGLGSPGTPDLPLASRPLAPAALGSGGAAARPGQEAAEAMVADRLPEPQPVDPQYADLIGKLEQVVAEHPDDIRGNRLLASGLMNLGRYAEGWRAYDRLIGLLGEDAGADLHAAKAEGMILAAGGYVSPQAEAEIATALEMDPALPIARFYSGMALRQSGRVEEAIATWRSLRRDSPADAPYLPWLDEVLAQAAPAGAGTSAPAEKAPAPPGPTGADIAAAAALSPEQRAAMVEGMVTRLEGRLTSEGGSAEEWLRLIRAYVQLDEPDEAARAYRLAAVALKDDPAAGFVREQALLMGVSVE